MSVTYNENEPFAAKWLRQLCRTGEITDGRVDDRDVRELRGRDFAGVERFHAFAGIGGWDLALRQAGWPEGAEVWTGSCPCQPFSQAGRRKGTKDDRHLWPEWRRLIATCLPPMSGR